MVTKKETGSLHLILIIIAAVILAGGWFVYQKFGGRITLPGKINLSCDPLTLVSLKQIYDASGVRPVSGDKCTISSDSYLLKLGYENYQQAEKAKLGLMAETTGTKKEIEGANLIIDQENSSAFYVEGEELKVLVMAGTTDEAKIKGMVLGLKSAVSTQDETAKSTNVLDPGGKATDSQIKSDMNQIKAGLELYFAEKEIYPKTLDELVTANIIKAIPTNPKTGKPYDFFSNGEVYTVSSTLSDGSLYQVTSEE